MLINTPISLGELVDKISILIIKKKNIKDQKKIDYVNKELDALQNTLIKYVNYNNIDKYLNELIVCFLSHGHSSLNLSMISTNLIKAFSFSFMFILLFNKLINFILYDNKYINIVIANFYLILQYENLFNYSCNDSFCFCCNSYKNYCKKRWKVCWYLRKSKSFFK